MTRTSARLRAQARAPGKRRSIRKRALVDYSGQDGSSGDGDEEYNPATVPLDTPAAFSPLTAPAAPLANIALDTSPIVLRAAPLVRKRITAEIKAALLSTDQHSRGQLRKLARATKVSDFLLHADEIRPEMQVARAIIFEYIGLVNAIERAVLLCSARTPESHDMMVGMMASFENLRPPAVTAPSELRHLLTYTHDHSRIMEEHIIANARFSRRGWGYVEQCVNWGQTQTRYHHVKCGDDDAWPIDALGDYARYEDIAVLGALVMLNDRYPAASLRKLVERASSVTVVDILRHFVENPPRGYATARTLLYLAEHCEFTAGEVLRCLRPYDVKLAGHIAELLCKACGVNNVKKLRGNEILADALVAKKSYMYDSLFEAGHITPELFVRCVVAYRGRHIPRMPTGHKLKCFINFTELRTTENVTKMLCKKSSRAAIARAVPGMPSVHFLVRIGLAAAAKITKEEAQVRDSRGRSLYYALSTADITYGEYSSHIVALAAAGVPTDNADGKGSPALLLMLRKSPNSFDGMWVVISHLLGGCSEIYDMRINSRWTVRERLVSHSRRYYMLKFGITADMLRTIFA